MKLLIKDREIYLDETKIMGILSLAKDDKRDLETLVNEVQSMYDYGAEFIEIGLEGDDISYEDEKRLLPPLINTIQEKLDIIIAIHTSNPRTMELCISEGAHMIIDPKALKEDGALEIVSKLKCPICLLFSPDIKIDDLVDPTSVISEFFYERIDACLNAKIERRRIIIDPSLSIFTSFDLRLKMIGRLSSYKSFGLVTSIAIPRALPYVDTYMTDNISLAITEGIFVSEHGCNIIRTKEVSNMALALDSWSALNESARPFRVSKAIVQRLKKKKKS